jgi:ubiquinone/menaquinone biosynthesis C-methylase UbiE
MTEKVSYRRYSGTAAENYERYFVPAIARPVATDLLRAANLQPGERVLDVACGTGIIARLAAEQVGPTGVVSGVDVAADMIEVARATAAPSEPVIKWSQGDAAALPSPTPERASPRSVEASPMRRGDARDATEVRPRVP